MEQQLKKKVALFVNEPRKAELEKSANSTLEKIAILKDKVKEQLKVEFSNPQETIQFIEKYNKHDAIENIEVQNELLFIKFNEEITKLMGDYKNLIKTKALEMFCTPSDREAIKEIITYAVSINQGISKINAKDLSLETFVLNEEFVYNNKIDTQLKPLYTTYCKNKKQIELKELAEKLKEIVDHSIRTGLIARNVLGVNIENIIDINTGEIKYNMIARF